MRWVVLGLGLSFVMSFLVTGSVQATQGGVWVKGWPKVLSSGFAETTAETMFVCHGVSRDITVAGIGDFEACVFGDEGGVQIARFIWQNVFHYGLRLPLDRQYYEFRGFCEGLWRCVYSSASRHRACPNEPYDAQKGTRSPYGSVSAREVSGRPHCFSWLLSVLARFGRAASG